MCKKFKLLFFLFLAAFQLFAQPSQIIRGKIYESISGKPITGATIQVLNSSFNGISNEGGNYRIQITPGRYSLKISAIGFESHVIPELMVDAGKEKVVDISLFEKVSQLNEVIIHPINSSTINPTSGRTFTVEETQRFAASFYDPARLVASFPGVTTTNDQANNISIRGNSPNALTWRLEGVEIVNPNHLTNAGTYTDRPMQNGGGTIILSAQLLANSQFLTGAFSPEFGGSTAGLFDMRLRKGNNEKQEYTVQAGLLGIDLATEGPFSKKKNASYLVNYRYSFTGLLGKLGVALGDEAIAYQDLALNFNLPTKNLGNFTIFGMYGASSNDFKAKPESERIFVKDLSIINYNSKMYAIGLTNEMQISKKSTLRTVFALSEKLNNRTENQFNVTASSYTGPNVDNLNNQRLSFSTIYNYHFSKWIQLKAGTYATEINDQATHGNLFQNSTPYAASFKSFLIQPFFNFGVNINQAILLNAGLHYQHLFKNSTKSFEPRASLTYKFNSKSNTTFAYSLQGQMPLLSAYGPESGTGFIAQNRNLAFSKAHHYVVNYTSLFGESLHFKAEIYLQKHFNQLTTKTKSGLSGMNLFDEYQLLVPLTNQGTATIKGLELSLEQYFQKKYYFLLSTTFYDSKYKGSDGIEHNSRFNGRFAANVTAGKEWGWVKKDKNRVFGLNLRGIYQGGYRESPIDVGSSRYFQRSIYFNGADKIFSLKLPDYYRIDLRLSLKRNKPSYTRTLSLDFQNVTNHLNTAYHYFDILQDKIIEQKQLGIIPVLNWRAEF